MPLLLAWSIHVSRMHRGDEHAMNIGRADEPPANLARVARRGAERRPARAVARPKSSVFVVRPIPSVERMNLPPKSELGPFVSPLMFARVLAQAAHARRILPRLPEARGPRQG